ncbi:MAG: glycosyl transferase, partial [Bacteroidaceae bacterium]|nr:glycosyl transferase [Bacteroidaceae bacterium]
MKVLIISTTERTGGGAIAAKRLLTALNKNGIKAKMLVRDKQMDDVNVASYGNVIPKVMERLRLMCRLLKPFRQTWQYDL